MRRQGAPGRSAPWNTRPCKAGDRKKPVLPCVVVREDGTRSAARSTGSAPATITAVRQAGRAFRILDGSQVASRVIAVGGGHAAQPVTVGEPASGAVIAGKSVAVRLGLAGEPAAFIRITMCRSDPYLLIYLSLGNLDCLWRLLSAMLALGLERWVVA
jgi:hypothetical protein